LCCSHWFEEIALLDVVLFGSGVATDRYDYCRLSVRPMF
jgi:hypothetical protein